MWSTAYSFADPPRITNELPEARLSVLKDLETRSVFLTTHSLETHFKGIRVSEYHKMRLSAYNCPKCIAVPKTNSNTPECPRIIQLVFLSKYRTLTALDTVSRGKWD
ncbi:hypothetical protein AAC387_Pa02g2098 [Persea americana]